MIFSLLLATTLATTIDAPEQILAPAEIARAVVAAVRERLESEGSTAQVEIAGRISAQPLPIGEVTVELGAVGGRWPRKRVGVPVQLWVDGRQVRTMTVWVELHDPRQVPSYVESYAMHTPGSEIRIESEVVDMICCAESTIGTAADLEGRRTVRPVRAGSPVMQSDLEILPDVLAQSEVEIVVRRGPVRVMTTGVALVDGEVGDLISVRPEQSRVAIQSRVVAEQKVLVDE